MQVNQLGEQALLKRLQRYCPAEIVGDDAALLTVAAGYSLVVTTDMRRARRKLDKPSISA